MQEDIYDCTVQYILENQTRFYRLAYSYVQDRQNALDVVQNAICRALEGCFALKNPAALKTWFYRILVNESLQYLRKQKREAPLSAEIADTLVYTEPAYEADGAVYAAVMRLPEAMKTVVLLRYYEDLPLRQIAEVTGAPLSTVKTRLYTALQRLREQQKEAEA